MQGLLVGVCLGVCELLLCLVLLCLVFPTPTTRDKRWDTHVFGQLQHFMIWWAIIEYCDFKVGNVSTSCFYAPRTRTDVPGDPSGPLYCVVFAVFGSRVFPHPIFYFCHRLFVSFSCLPHNLSFPTWSPPEVLKYL